MFQRVSRFLPRRPTKMMPPRINWSRVTKPRPSAVYGALSSKVATLNLYSVLSKMQWTHRPTTTPVRPCQPRYVTLVGGHAVPFHPFETQFSKVQRRALGRVLFAIPEDCDSETADEDDA
ncbi:hypothetical protein SPRG_07471 [Saprolegnia parasitica CBS 223.65]|uniref:Uncharacterized protein n=1 Tax=Saprolegnia parasitica (strain CBS 223.65) TaxID=695850 RepID=A0A067CKD2_SAPPC|nr:hypothetical protein SPRG_07471 [Saprolegnia parasitica CBS 223.65]KDO27222.1 hypothetical protein SPRG_07471 [Saprolegnia parasitica CBS 223.65]|eukprot:XP_012202000.1 hypothetical protein SPRG_07471 [Saprolegnia parasitica CBS 223.65]